MRAGRIMGVTALVLAGVLAGWCGGQALRHPSTSPRPIDPRGPLGPQEQALIDQFKAARSSVVYITSIAYQRDWLSFDVQAVATGTGSGFVWDEAGHIVTNFHVIQNAQEFEVTFANQETHRAKVVGVAPEKDLAVLRLVTPPRELRPIPIGTSSDLQVGQSVIAIGNPFGLDQTLTTGIISALGREIQSPARRHIMGVIQTDAAINPGNSGGPLLDSAGRLVGVNTAIQSTSGSSAGIGFAVPVDIVNRVVPQLIAHGQNPQPEPGFTPLPAAYASYFKAPEGVVVLKVTPGSPAERAGLRGLTRSGNRYILGDVILSMNGKPTPDWNRFLDRLYEEPIGSTVTLEVQNQGQKRRVSFRIEAAAL
ncbi:S1C family serine protease [Holophaga foetida]|uniref:S1C family serine protease n=1 Tax=Holophaga foetida TaxID=35839 RepID=UPI000247375C|nr:trypsin-like peptidase domain-containing protein [Holophaga foetida]